MNIEAYDSESLRHIVRLLEYENSLLKEKLDKENIPDAVSNVADTSYKGLREVSFTLKEF